MNEVTLVERRSQRQIETAAGELRKLFGYAPDQRVHLAELLELWLPQLIKNYLFDVVPDDQIKGRFATTDLRRPVVRFSESSYAGLRRGDPHGRFTAAHEIGHVLLHCGRRLHYARRSTIDKECCPEWQADAFAAALLMPEEGFRQCATIEQAMERFGVGWRAARWRAQSLRHRFKQSPTAKNKGSKRMRRSP